MKKEYKNMLKNNIKKEDIIEFIESIRFDLSKIIEKNDIVKLIIINDDLDFLAQSIWEDIKEKKGVF